MAQWSAKSWFRVMIKPYLDQIKSVLVSTYVRIVDLKTIAGVSLYANNGGDIGLKTVNNQQLIGAGNIDVAGAAWSTGTATVVTTVQSNGAAGTSPTKPNSNLIFRDRIRSRRVAANLYSISMSYSHTGTTGANNGTGIAYIWQLPDSLQFNTTAHPLYTGTVANPASAIVSRFSITESVATAIADVYEGIALIVPYTATTFRIFVIKGDAEMGWVGPGQYQIASWTSLAYQAFFTITTSNA